jgi:hypothetical protein
LVALDASTPVPPRLTATATTSTDVDIERLKNLLGEYSKLYNYILNLETAIIKATSNSDKVLKENDIRHPDYWQIIKRYYEQAIYR